MVYSSFGATGYTVGNGSIEKLREYQKERVGLVIDENIVNALGLGQLLYEDILQTQNTRSFVMFRWNLPRRC